jgi:hypothetical protein
VLVEGVQVKSRGTAGEYGLTEPHGMVDADLALTFLGRFNLQLDREFRGQFLAGELQNAP